LFIAETTCDELPAFAGFGDAEGFMDMGTESRFTSSRRYSFYSHGSLA
jgi:hypothetical protein